MKPHGTEAAGWPVMLNGNVNGIQAYGGTGFPAISFGLSSPIAKGKPGKSFVFVSGLGGYNIRDQKRCRPTTFPYGCKGEWATIYTRSQGATFGALFIVFNTKGDPAAAHGYFKTVDGHIVDRFDLTVDVSAGSSR